MTPARRKGARSTKDIPKDILVQLNRGEIETANLVEWLAVDQRILLEHFLTQTDRIQYLKPVLAGIDNLKKQTVNTINEAIGTGLLVQAMTNNDAEILVNMSASTSDLVRCWGTYTIGKNPSLDLEKMLQQIQPFAADKHFGVREISWMAVRPSIALHLNEGLRILSTWARHTDENVRRFASEATRPRGVWCEHIEKLKEQPELGLVILESMKSDSSKYVQDSVGNWLNDASKTQPQFVSDICKKWNSESQTKQTAYIIKKALRTIER